MKRAAALLLVLLLAALAPTAVAAWLVSASGTGRASASTIERGAAPAATAGPGQVTLTWPATRLSSGAGVTGYRVLRHDGATVTTACTAVAPATTCQDPSPVPTTVSYGVVATVSSWAGAESPLTSFTFDTTAPETTASITPAPNAAGWSNTDVSVLLSATDSGAGVVSVVWSLDGGAPVTTAGASVTVPVSGTGEHTLVFHAVDRAGNVEATRTRTIRIDPVAPVTGVTYTDASGSSASPKAWYAGDVTLGFAATDSGGSGVRSVAVDGVPSPGSTASRTVTGSGPTTVAFRATDVADNVEPPRSVTVRIDRSAPTSTISPADSGTWVRAATQSFTLDARDVSGTAGADSGVASLTYAVDGGTPVVVGAAQLPVTPAALGQGAHTVTYSALDVAGNRQATQTARLWVDQVAPVTTFAQQPGGGQVSLTASDAVSGVASVSYKVDTGPYVQVSGSTAAPVVSPGTHTLTWRATDVAGNVEAETSRSVTIAGDTTAPTLAISDPSAGASYPVGNSGTGSWAKVCGSGRVCASVTDTESGVNATTVTYTLTASTGANAGRCWSGSAWTAGTSCAAGMTLAAGTWSGGTIDRSQMAPGSYSLTVRAGDNAGNTTSQTLGFSTRP